MDVHVEETATPKRKLDFPTPPLTTTTKKLWRMPKELSDMEEGVQEKLLPFYKYPVHNKELLTPVQLAGFHYILSKTKDQGMKQILFTLTTILTIIYFTILFAH